MRRFFYFFFWLLTTALLVCPTISDISVVLSLASSSTASHSYLLLLLVITRFVAAPTITNNQLANYNHIDVSLFDYMTLPHNTPHFIHRLWSIKINCPLYACCFIVWPVCVIVFGLVYIHIHIYLSVCLHANSVLMKLYNKHITQRQHTFFLVLFSNGTLLKKLPTWRIHLDYLILILVSSIRLLCEC